jgi:hypothetical protein
MTFDLYSLSECTPFLRDFAMLFTRAAGVGINRE